MPKYHVHVYRLAEMTEVDLEADTPQAAMKEALARAEKQEWKEADNKYIALPFEMDGYSMGSEVENLKSTRPKMDPVHPSCWNCDGPNIEMRVHDHTFRYGVGDAAQDITATVPYNYCLDCGEISHGEPAELIMDHVVARLKKEGKL